MRCAFALLFVLMVFALPAHAAGPNRCVDANGTSIFTDKPCADIGAAVRPEPAPAAGASTRWRLHARSCARTTDDLLHGLKSALGAGDVNQAAAFYHWPGSTTTSSEGILKRLQAMADRPLLSIELIRQQPTRQPIDADGFQIVASEQDPDPIGLDVVQTRSASDTTPMRTEFALTQYMGCWWVRFQ